MSSLFRPSLPAAVDVDIALLFPTAVLLLLTDVVFDAALASLWWGGGGSYRLGLRGRDATIAIPWWQ
jgi:hypothetical protein